ncbi:MAG TPA: DUF1566 domain-containing protein [Smithella sp.]|nr:DUF1566 domain-containing protein [Smithella sp.]
MMEIRNVQSSTIKDKAALFIVTSVFTSMLGLILSCAGVPEKQWHNNSTTIGQSVRDTQDDGSLADELQPQTDSIGRSPATDHSRDDNFVALENGTVLDKKTNLMWASKDNGANINWHDAKLYCEQYNGGSYTDWRMPTIDELADLYDHGKEQTSGYHIIDFITITRALQWSSDTDGSNMVAVLYFYDGETVWNIPSTSSYRVLPVRDAQHDFRILLSKIFPSLISAPR